MSAVPPSQTQERPPRPLPGYRDLRLERQASDTLIYNAVRERDNLPVMLQLPRPDARPERVAAQLRAEYTLLQSLDSNLVWHALDLYDEQQTVALVMAYTSAVPLSQHLATATVTLRAALSIGRSIARGLGYLHAQQVVHQNINPGTVYINPATTGIMLTNFRLAQHQTADRRPFRPTTPVGNLEYISPEQTGRIALDVDYRSDFYALGVTLYQLLTGQLPFASQDPLQLVYHHLATDPVPLRQINPQVAPGLERVVLKLLAKMPEDRYQSAYAIEQDLDTCRRLIDQDPGLATEADFEIALDDIPEQLTISKRLLERETALAELAQCLDNANQGGTELLVCAGPEGTGKSALLRALRQHNTQLGGMSGTTVLSPASMHEPYQAIIHGFDDVSRQLLARPDLAALTSSLRLALGANIASLAARVAGFGFIAAPPAKDGPSAKLAAEDMHKHTADDTGDPAVDDPVDDTADEPLDDADLLQLSSALTTVMGVLAAQGRPLLLCIDNLHWIDKQSMSLLEQMLRGGTIPHIVLAGGHATEPLNPGQLVDSAFGSLLNRLLEPPARVRQIVTTNLSVIGTARLLADTLYQGPEETLPLAEIVHAKTQGNPAAIAEFLLQLNQAKILSFDRQHREWQWDSDHVAGQPPAANVAVQLASQLPALAPPVLATLQMLACLGGEADEPTLERLAGITAAMAGTTSIPTSQLLASATAAGYLLSNWPNPNTALGLEPAFTFAHPAIETAVYSSMPASDRQQYHQQISHLLLRNNSEVDDGTLLERVSQLNNSFELLDSLAADRTKLANLNLAAGRVARQAGTYPAAFKYLKTAIALYGETIWQDYERSLEIHRLAAECAFLSGDADQLAQLTKRTIEHCQTALDQASVMEITLRALLAEGAIHQALAQGQAILDLLDEPLPARAFSLATLRLAGQLLLATRSAQASHVMHDPRRLAVMRTLMNLCHAGYFAGDLRTGVFVLKMAQMSLRYGAAPESVFAYPMLGAMLISHLGTIEGGYRYGTLASDHARLWPRGIDPQLQVKHTTLSNTLILHWKQPLRDSLEPLSQAYQLGMAQGEHEFSLIAAVTGSANAFLLGQDLNTLQSNLSNYHQQAAQFNQTPMLSMSAIYLQAVNNLMRPGAVPWLFEGDIYDELTALPFHISSGDESSIANLYILKTFLAVLFGQPQLALDYSRSARRHIRALISSPAVPFFILYESLACVACLADAGLLLRLRLLSRLKTNRRLLGKWAQHAPTNVLHGYHLIEAELAGYDQHLSVATSHYERAIELAERNGYQKEYCLANELAGRFHFDQGHNTLGQFYLEQARDGYSRWGASAKVAALEHEYQTLAAISPISPTNITGQPRLPSDVFANYTNFLDLGAVIKASQVLSGEVFLTRLLERLMEVALENAGAHRASLLLQRGDELMLEITSRYARGEAQHQRQQTALEQVDNLPLSVVQYVARTAQDLVLNDVQHEDIFTQDKYIVQARPKSVLCIPIMSRANLTGVLYIENNQNQHSFSEERIAILKLLASQSAIAIENARLYQQLNDSRNKYLSLFQNAVEGIFEISPDGTLTNANPAAALLLGYASADELLKAPNFKLPNLFVLDSDIDKLTDLLRRERRVIGFETQMRRPDNSEHWVALSAKIVVDDNEKFQHIEGSMIDITERKLREAAEQGVRLAQAETATKSEFLANMSHEIRTPMNAIIGYTELALQTPLSQQQGQYLQTIRRSSSHLLHVVNDILDLSRIESGKMTIDKQAFSLSAIITDLQDLFALGAAEKGIILELPTDTGDELYLGDPVRIGQILINLVSNAIKFTDRGAVRVSAVPQPRRDKHLNLVFTITDTGRGIEPALLPQIFESFNRGQADDNIAGTGLGLTICKRLVGLMDGDIKASSIEHAGSRFEFFVVVEPCPADYAIQKPVQREFQSSGELSGRKILVVEDNLINQDLAREVLTNNGALVTVASDGGAALEILAKEDFFVILMDLRMPGMDGFATIKRIRDNPKLRNATVIALSAGVLGHEISRALDSGFDYYLSKPVDFNELVQLLQKLGHIPEPLSSSQEPAIESALAANAANNAPSTSGGVDAPHVDLALALRMHDHDNNLLLRLLAEFDRLYSTADQQLQSLVDKGDGPAALNLAHNIAGVAGSFGANYLMVLARQLEHQLATSDAATTVELDEFSAALQEFREISQAYQQQQDTSNAPALPPKAPHQGT